jgi:hypothetical protein
MKLSLWCNRDYVSTTFPEGVDDEEPVFVIAMTFFLNDVGRSRYCSASDFTLAAHSFLPETPYSQSRQQDRSGIPSHHLFRL